MSKPPPQPPPSPYTWLKNLTKHKPEALLTQIRKEFKTIAGGASDRNIGPHKVGSDQLKFFRYHNVPLLEATRVPLGRSAVGAEFYHANFVTLGQGRPVFIAAMAPEQHSESVFWSIIWDQQITRVVCLTDVFEQSREKTSKYWPDPGNPKIIDHFSIKNTGTNQEQGYVVSTLEVQNTKTNETRSMEHWFYTEWPDQSGPYCSHSVLDMADKLYSMVQSTLIHCSAGVGRTGCVLAILIMKMKLEKGEPIILSEIVHSIRMHRARCIQSDIQYIFLYWCAVLEHLKKCTLSDAEKATIHKKLRFLRDNSTSSQCSINRRRFKKRNASALHTKKAVTEGTSAEAPKSVFTKFTELLSFKKKKESSTPSAESLKIIRKHRKGGKKKPPTASDDKGQPKPPIAPDDKGQPKPPTTPDDKGQPKPTTAPDDKGQPKPQ